MTKPKVRIDQETGVKWYRYNGWDSPVPGWVRVTILVVDPGYPPVYCTDFASNVDWSSEMCDDDIEEYSIEGESVVKARLLRECIRKFREESDDLADFVLDSDEVTKLEDFLTLVDALV